MPLRQFFGGKENFCKFNLHRASTLEAFNLNFETQLEFYKIIHFSVVKAHEQFCRNIFTDNFAVYKKYKITRLNKVLVKITIEIKF